MNAGTSFNFEVATRSTVLKHLSSELLYEVICSVNCFFVFEFAVFELHQAVHHGVVGLLSLDVGQVCVILHILKFYYVVFGVTGCFEVIDSSLFDFSINLVQSVLLFRR